ncbi:hypothetical protein BJY52DRAFT_1188889 [Lactarius psammicola]|nr:hypothetical protein BJY52DRAFT_1188889 [Lactarius psammicola]
MPRRTSVLERIAGYQLANYLRAIGDEPDSARAFQSVRESVCDELCPPLGTPSTNAHADETRATTSKKRKHQNTPAATAKKLKTSNAMAIPTGGNSVRNICMRSWNERQPGGQGPLSEFDSYFKSLTDAQKEPFKKEQCTAQATARKAKVAAKKANSVPNAN